MKTSLLPVSMLLALSAAATPAAAQALVDPMRPATAAPGDGEVAVARSGGPVLEQIVLGDGRKFAVISGRRVALGDKVGEATVIAIGPDQVTLKGVTTQVLRMFPRAERRNAGAGPVPQSRKAEEGS
jgi:MSHA biogenesis protein MshK